MKKALFILALVLIATHLQAQSQERSINAQIGLGISTPYYSNDEIGGTGFFLEGEYVMRLRSWFELKPFAGLILTSSNGKDLNDNPTNEIAT